MTVTDPMNRFVTGLEKEHFKLTEEKAEQTITQFSSEDAPLSVGLVFDASGSMGSKLSKSRQAAAQLFKTANPEDEFFLVHFNNRPELVGWVHHQHGRNPEPADLHAGERTDRAARRRVYGHEPDEEGAATRGRRSLSSPTAATTAAAIPRARSRISFAKPMFKSMRSASSNRWPAGAARREELAGPGLLTELAESTGGRHFPVENLNELPDVAAKIGIELRNQYVLGYTPTNHDEGWEVSAGSGETEAAARSSSAEGFL